MLNTQDYQENDLVKITNENSAYFHMKGIVHKVRKYVIEVDLGVEGIIPFMAFEIERN